MKFNILIIYSSRSGVTGAVSDYVAAFKSYSYNRIHYFDVDSNSALVDINNFDCLIFSYCSWDRVNLNDEGFLNKISRFNGLKIAILQDEYDNFRWAQRIFETLGITTVVTCVPSNYCRKVYFSSYFDRVDFIYALTGYVTEQLKNTPIPLPLSMRQWSIGYRGRVPPYHYGLLAREKIIICNFFLKVCAERRISSNISISEDTRLYGKQWHDFIRGCRVLLGTESGSNVFDFDGDIRSAISEYLKENPKASFEEVFERFLKRSDGHIVMNQISPRIFEAIGFRTALLLFKGEYSGVIKPWVHYIPLDKDFGNLDEVLSVVADDRLLEEMTERAYEDVILSGKYDYNKFISSIDEYVERKMVRPKGGLPIYAIIGWRDSNSGLMRPCFAWQPNLTLNPLHHLDHYPERLFVFYINWRALRKVSLVNIYYSLQRTQIIIWLKLKLRNYVKIYDRLRAFALWASGQR